MPEWFTTMTTSDWLLALFAAGALWFVLDYGLFSPWWRHPIGWVVMVYGISVLLLMLLIIYGVVVGERIDEWARQLVAGLLVLGIAGKIIVLHVSRHEGRIERRRTRAEGSSAASEALSASQTRFQGPLKPSAPDMTPQRPGLTPPAAQTSVDYGGDGD